MNKLNWLNQATESDAADELERLCGASHWIARVLAARPFKSPDALTQAARSAFTTLSAADWREAFEHHPRIGGKVEANAGAEWARQEQAATARATDPEREELARLNDAYFERFGFIFIVCATGKATSEMLSLLKARLPNPIEREIGIAAEEQRKITELRLQKWLGENRV